MLKDGEGVVMMGLFGGNNAESERLQKLQSLLEHKQMILEEKEKHLNKLAQDLEHNANIDKQTEALIDEQRELLKNWENKLALKASSLDELAMNQVESDTETLTNMIIAYRNADFAKLSASDKKKILDEALDHVDNAVKALMDCF